MKRAVVVFVEGKRNLLMEFFALYESFKNLNNKDTDLVVFCTRDIIDFIPEDCIKIESKSFGECEELKNYNYINSIACLNSAEAGFLWEYDLILRTDCDTFLTPAWNDYYPKLYTVGKGGYVNDNKTREKIKVISKKLNLKHKNIFNIGSTHYGNAQLVLCVANLAVGITKYILKNEFSDNDGMWPGWYKGVSLLYAMEIATNHIVERVIIDGKMLDYISTASDSIYMHPHIHCWHTNNKFSKFMFESGKYDDIDINTLDLKKVNEYCMHMALKSKGRI